MQDLLIQAKLQIESEAYDPNYSSTSIIIPEDITINLYTGASVPRSGLQCNDCTEHTPKGYKIYGYDIINPYFKTYKPLRNSSSRTVRVGGKDISPGGYLSD